MTVTEAMGIRKSIRAFKQDPPDEAVLREILELAAHTPSWANSQPWEVYVATGAALERIRAAYAENYKNAVKSVLDTPRPAEWTEANKERTRNLRPDMVRDCGEAADEFGALNQCIFHAPAVIYLCVDKILAHWALYDTGAYSQSVMLLATERGLGTIASITSVAYPEVLHRELGIPDTLNVAIGIPIGYADWEHKINNFNSARSPIEDNVKFVK